MFTILLERDISIRIGLPLIENDNQQTDGQMY
jgi:hypothetical protein